MEKRTYAQLREIDEIVGTLYTNDPTLRNTKFGYWYTRFYKKNVQPILDEISDKMADVRIDNALVDPKTQEILYTDANQKTFKFDKEGLKKILEFSRKLSKEYDDKEFDVTPCISVEVPPGLHKEEAKILNGLLI